MHLYNITLHRPSTINQAVHGNFSGSKQQELAVGRGRILEILKPDPQTGKVYTLLSVEVIGIIRALKTFRLTGSTKDYLVIGSDSGRIVILEYNASKNALIRVHQETFGKSGCRRVIPGQFLAIDPKGRAVMIGAVEKQKLCYIMNRDAEARLTISSPLEAHKANTYTYYIVGVDVGFENPLFACLEMDYEEMDASATAETPSQFLTYYELDLGLNHVVRKYNEALDDTANLLIAVPGGNDGPSGVLVCSENYITYKNLGDQPDIRVPIPRRRNDLDDPERGLLIVCSATHKTRSMFFFLVQTEQGDVFKITLEVDEDMVTEMKLKYFDTIPVASALVVLKTGFLFVASEFGNHYLYQIAHLGENDDEMEFSSQMPLEEGETFFFAPRGLKNLVQVEEIDSLSPIVTCQIAELTNDDTPQIYAACGRGTRSSFRILKHGLEVSEMAVSELPGSPNAVWTVRKSAEEDYDSYIIVSFVNATLVLSIGETVEEVTDSGFLGTTPTLSCSLIVPGGNDGPSGVLVCSENYITYKNLGDQPDIRVPIPRRRNDLDDPERGLLIVCSATHKTRSMFFFLVQTEQGDVFKITLEVDEDMVTEMKLKYFDTIPVASALVVLKTGFLFVASEFGNHYLYQIAHLGENDDEMEFSSQMPLEEGETFFFAPRGLKNLVQVEEIDSLSPIVTCQIAELTNDDTPQIYAACGRGTRSSFRILKHGLEVSEMAVSELPGSPNAVWTVRKSAEEDYDSYIIVSFVNATLVLSIGETVEEVTDSGFLGTTPTLSCSLIGDDALLQVYPSGIRHIRADRRVNEWKTPGKRSIIACAVNQRQVCIALYGGELVYFELDPSGQLNEYTERKDLQTDVICMCLPTSPEGEIRSRFLAVGLADQTIRIISLDPSDCLQPLSMQALPAAPEALCIVKMPGSDNTDRALFLNVGLQNGVLLRTVLDQVTGDLSDTRSRYLGNQPVKLFKVSIQNKEAVLAMSSRTWLGYVYQSRYHLTPLSYEALDHASGFASEQCPEGIVAISSNTLRILALEKLGAVFNQQAAPLKYTPRKFIIHSPSSNIFMIEADHNCFTTQSKKQRKQQMAEEMIQSAGESERELAAEVAASFLQENLPEDVFGSPKAGPGMWASILRILKPTDGSTVKHVELEQNEAAFSIAFVRFANRPGEQYLLLGTAKGFRLNPPSITVGYVYTYRVPDSGDSFEFIHRTEMEDVALAVSEFKGRVLIGVGKWLRLYDMGRKKLLKKCENKHLTNKIMTIHSNGYRIFVTDVQDSVTFLKYKPVENQMIIFADDPCQRFCMASCIVDYDTLAVTDKFGTLSVLRLPEDVNDQVEDDPTGARALWDRGWCNGAAQKAELLCNYNIGGDMALTLQKCTLIPGGSECIVYTTISGSIGALLPINMHEDAEFFQHLEMHIRQESPSYVGRDHLAYRSYYSPVKNVIDGDLCETFNSLDAAKQKSIAEELDRVPTEISKKLEDIRTRFAF